MITMLLWVLYLAVSFFSGVAVSSILSIRHSMCLPERVLFSFVLGNAISVWLTFLVACFSGALSIYGVTLSTGIIALISSVILAYRLFKDRTGYEDKRICDGIDLDKGRIRGRGSRGRDGYTLLFLLFILVYLAVMNLYGVLRTDSAGNIYALHTVWADYPFHTSLIASFVYQPHFSFPPPYPQFWHTEMHYPFLMDFYSAVLMKSGLDLRSSIIIPDMLFQTSLFGLFYFLAYRMTGLRIAGALGTVVFIFAGFPPGLQAGGLHFLNPAYAVLMPQRTAMFGMSVSFAVYIILFEWLSSHESASPVVERGRELVVAGMLTGMLPYIHAHSFMVTSFVILSLALVLLLAMRGVKLRELVYIFAPLIALALPQVLSIRAGVTAGFFNFYPGWTDANRSIITAMNWSSLPAVICSSAETAVLLISFWAENAGALIILACLGLLKARESGNSRLLLFYLPFLALFLLSNVVKYQPWYFDNYKVFIYWLAVSAALAPLSIKWVRDIEPGSIRIWGAFSICVLLIACTLFGVVTHVGMLKYEYKVWSAADIAIGKWVEENTDPGGVFLTGSAHNHPVTALAGRQRVMGYEGWLWSHGLNWSEITRVKREEIEMYRGNYQLIKDYGIDYICIGPYERDFARDNHFEINYTAFEDRTRFQLILRYSVNNSEWRIYRAL